MPHFFSFWNLWRNAVCLQAGKSSKKRCADSLQRIHVEECYGEKGVWKTGFMLWGKTIHLNAFASITACILLCVWLNCSTFRKDVEISFLDNQPGRHLNQSYWEIKIWLITSQLILVSSFISIFNVHGHTWPPCLININKFYLVYCLLFLIKLVCPTFVLCQFIFKTVAKVSIYVIW